MDFEMAVTLPLFFWLLSEHVCVWVCARIADWKKIIRQIRRECLESEGKREETERRRERERERERRRGGKREREREKENCEKKDADNDVK